MNMPTLQAREITAELDRGSGALISNALLPAYYAQLDTLFDYMPDDARFVWSDPIAIAESIEVEHRNARDEHNARSDRPTFDLPAYYMNHEELVDRLETRASLVAHRLTVQEALEARYLLWSASADRKQLEECQRLLGVLLEGVEEEARNRMVADVPLHFGIRAGATATSGNEESDEQAAVT